MNASNWPIIVTPILMLVVILGSALREIDQLKARIKQLELEQGATVTKVDEAGHLGD